MCSKCGQCPTATHPNCFLLLLGKKRNAGRFLKTDSSAVKESFIVCFLSNLISIWWQIVMVTTERRTGSTYRKQSGYPASETVAPGNAAECRKIPLKTAPQLRGLIESEDWWGRSIYHATPLQLPRSRALLISVSPCHKCKRSWGILRKQQLSVFHCRYEHQ